MDCGFLGPPVLQATPRSKTPKNQCSRFVPAPADPRVNYGNPLPDPRIVQYLSCMDRLPLAHTKWSDRLAFDVALALEGSGETMDEIKERHRIRTSQLLSFNKDPVFLKKVEHYREEVRDKGLTFRLKARAQAEELLTTSWTLIHSAEVSPAVKADLIKSTVKWAGLETKTDEGTGGSSGGVKININFGNNAPTMTLTADVEGEAIDLDPDTV